MKGKKIAELALLTSISLMMFMLESVTVPLFPAAPYVKLGLSNCILLFVLYRFGLRDAYVVLLVKVIAGSLIAGNWYAFAFNLSGGFAAVSAMGLLHFFGKDNFSVLAISVAGAVMSNIIRTAIGAVIMQTAGLFYALPAILIISTAGGLVSGAMSVSGLIFFEKKESNCL